MYRPPICSVIGAVDAGKTTLLDKLRSSHTQEKEAGGITQKIGISYFSQDVLNQLSRSLNKSLFIPGLLLLDTPGHDCFTNQRLSGIEISDIVVVVINIFKGIEMQTIEILKLLKQNRTPFCVVANKVDKLYQWLPPSNNQKKLYNLKKSLAKQNAEVKHLLDEKLNELIVQFAEAGLNALPYYRNSDLKHFISIVPISSKTGEGIPDLIVLMDLLTKKFMKRKLDWSNAGNASGFVLEKMRDRRAGDFYAIVLTKGTLNQGDILLVQAENGDVQEVRVSQLMVPKEGTEVKDDFHFDYIRQADQAKSYLVKMDSDVTIQSASQFHGFGDHTDLKLEFISQMQERYMRKQELVMHKEFQTPGIHISAPTLGTVEALYRLCRSHLIPVSGLHVGTLDKRTLIKATTTRETFRPETAEEKEYYNRYNCVLLFDKSPHVDIEKLATQYNLQLIHNEIIYRLVEEYEHLCKESNDRLRKMHPNLLPRCEVKVLSHFIFMKRNPILMGVRVLKNKLYPNMIIQACTASKPYKRKCIVGKVISIQKNNKNLTEAEEGTEVCVKFLPVPGIKIPEYEHDFDSSDRLVSYYTKQEVELMKQFPLVFSLSC